MKLREQWFKIKCTDEDYFISDSFKIKRGDFINSYGVLVKEHLIKATRYDKGYFTVHMVKNGKQKTFLLHRLIAETFIPNPDKKPFVNHIDGDKHNNNLDNLEWCSFKENIEHAWRIGLYKKNQYRNLKANDVFGILKMLEYNFKHKDIAELYKTHPSTVSDIKRGVRFKQLLKIYKETL